MSETKLPKVLTREDLASYSNNLTVGDLKKFIEEQGIPDDAKVMIQRVEDKYFENNETSVKTYKGRVLHVFE